MIQIEYLQNYWWLLIAVLGAALVFMLFVQGGQTMLFQRMPEAERNAIVTKLGHKWELTFTTLVVFGGAFFAAFPLFYSTSFGGAYWLWMSILISFVLQAVSYEFRSKAGNLFGTRTYDVFLLINGCVGCVLLGVAVSMMFFGAEFTVSKGNLLDISSPIISSWSSTHGIEAIADWRNLILGIAILLLARTQASLYFISALSNTQSDDSRWRKHTLYNGIAFAIAFIAFIALLLTSRGVQIGENGSMQWSDYKYLHNFIELWWVAAIFLTGTAMALYGILRTAFSKTWHCGIWWSGIGSAMAVISLFSAAGYNDTAYYPSLIDVESSLGIANSSSSHFTLSVMSYVSLIVPFVLAYIAAVWRAMSRPDATSGNEISY